MTAERMFRGDTMLFDIVVNADGSPIDAGAKLWFVLKHKLSDHDARALAILTTDTAGGIRSNIPSAGSARALVLPASTASLPSKLTRLEYAWRLRDAQGNVYTPKTGVVFVDATAPIALDAMGVGGSIVTDVIGSLSRTLSPLTVSAAGTSGAPTLQVLSDASITDDGFGRVSAWGPFTQSDPTKRPLLITDTVTGKIVVRFDLGTFLTMPAGAADFLHQRACTLLLVWRQRIKVAAADQVLLDTSGNGATNGYQLRALDAQGLGHYRQIRARISDGSTWVIDHTSGGPFCNYMALKWNVTTIQTSATQHVLSVDHCEAFRDTLSVTLPSGSGGALTLGGFQGDVMALEVWA